MSVLDQNFFIIMVNMDQLQKFVVQVSSHSRSCQNGSISLTGERYREGLASVLSATSSGCRMEVAFPTSSKVTGLGGGQRWECNLAAVWGQMSTGGGHAPLAESMSVLGVPVMTKKSFVATEKALGRSWRESLEESMKEAAGEEKRKNWDGPSSSMETDILVQGFKEAETKYGLCYTTFTGDGDSSVHANLVTQVPGWGHTIRKVECANHAVKCYRGALEKLVAEKPHYKGKGKLTVAMRKRLTTAARCAIKMRSTGSDVKRATELLQQDLRNGPLHCFSVHTNCSTNYCKVTRSSQIHVPDTTDIHVYSSPTMQVHVGRRAPQALTRMDQSAQLLPRRSSSGGMPSLRRSLRLSALSLRSCRLTLTQC